VSRIEQHRHPFSETLLLTRANLENWLLDESPGEMTMKIANMREVLVVSFLVAGCSNQTQQVISRTTSPINVGVTSSSPSSHSSQTVSENSRTEVTVPGREVIGRANPDLLHAISVASDHDKREFCQASQSLDCDQEFLKAFHFRKVTLRTSGQVGFIVEFSGAGFCGSAGCAINVLKQSGDKYERTFENDEVGSLDSFELGPTNTNGFYDLTKHGSHGTDYHYTWTGSNYEDMNLPLSPGRREPLLGLPSLHR
jgi:hypothetical protein